MKQMQLTGLIIVLILGTAAFAAAQVTTDSAAPDFTLTDTAGQAHSLSDYSGRFVVLEWTNHDCPFVRKHYDSRNMQNLQQVFTNKGVVWLTVNSSAPGKQGNYPPMELSKMTAAEGAQPTAYLLDIDGAVGRLYGAQTTPHMYVIDPKGTLIYQGAIDSISSTDPSDIYKATNYVTQALNQAMGGDPVSVKATKSYGCSVKY